MQDNLRPLNQHPLNPEEVTKFQDGFLRKYEKVLSALDDCNRPTEQPKTEFMEGYHWLVFK